jgi:hypothetical protein
MPPNFPQVYFKRKQANALVFIVKNPWVERRIGGFALVGGGGGGKGPKGGGKGGGDETGEKE